MKKILILLFAIAFIIFPLTTVSVKASSTEYLAYSEIIMSSGKLLRDFTKEEMDDALKHTEGNYCFTIKIYPVNKNVRATYISQTVMSYYNTSGTDVTFTKLIEVETNQKVSFNTGGSLSASASGNIKKVKAEAAAKGNVSYSKQQEKSYKEKLEEKFVIEAGSSIIVYLTGSLIISNGVASVYDFFYRLCYGGYEFVTITEQYTRVVKSTEF